MNDTAELEHGYRRLLAWYPRTFRFSSEDEVLGVLMTGARPDQRRPGLAESADLIWSALWMRLRPAPSRPPTVRAAVWLMYLGAVTEVGALMTIIATRASVRSAVLARHPAAPAAVLHAVLGQVTLSEVAAPVAVVLWLVLAWANGRGYDRARVAFLPFFAVFSAAFLLKLGLGAATYAPADLAANAVLWLVGLAVSVLLFSRASGAFYGRQTA
jgi:hypothetical protein